MWSNYGSFGPYVPVGVRLARAQKAMEKRRRQGHPVTPVRVEGRTIATSFWGQAWCRNIERYGDFASRLPRGRTYLRNGSVVDLQVSGGRVDAFVAGSELYAVKVLVSALLPEPWAALCRECVGSIDSLVELLRGELNAAVMERVCRPEVGLFPAPKEITFTCSCPDGAYLCKHVAAVLYGVGARLDRDPELLFRLREVSAAQLVAGAGASTTLTQRGPRSARVLDADDVAEVFGLDVASPASPAPPPPRPARASRRSQTAATSQGGAQGRTGAKPSARVRALKAPASDAAVVARAKRATPARRAKRPAGKRPGRDERSGA